MLDPELAAAYEDLQDRLRDRIIKLWQTELNARRGKQGAIREDIGRVEVVELRHERSRSLDPHKHRHLWLNVKVQGMDLKWSNVDTRVALRFQNVVNAEGDLASRTDPAWITALASKGFTLNSDGEIDQLQHLVRPLSKRSAQIETNKASHLRAWRERHPDEEPSSTVLTQIDQWAWATGRPNKPGHVNEDDWASIVRADVLQADPELGRPRREIAIRPAAVESLDVELLAAKAIVDADARSTGTGGRFSDMDIRAGAIRAIASSGVVAERRQFAEVLDEVVSRATSVHTVTLLTEPNVPAHVKQRMAISTATLKATLARRVELISAPGATLSTEEVEAVGQAVEPGHTLDRGQLAGVAAIAGTSRSVAVSGAAGTGKTTMLKVAGAALRRRGRNMIIVAPTKKASAVAGRETQSASSSLHQLLHDYGWRWSTNEAGATQWRCLQIGDIDQTTGLTYTGPRIAVSPGDRIVVDEAGMLDLEGANALVDVLERTHSTVALVGDERQALPVGHSGAMALFWTHSADQVELTAIHRFKDSAWANVTQRLRDPHGREASEGVADELIDTGHVILANSEYEARAQMVSAWFEAVEQRQTIALVTATHAEAQAISEDIQSGRVHAGQIDTTESTSGQGGQPIFVGDVVQTRRNDHRADVQNRQHWVVKRITAAHVILASSTDSTDVKKITHEYAGAHLHLGYASTVYGVQGETTDCALVGPGVDAAGLYVGLTRGKENNDIVLVAPTRASARSQLVEMMQRQTIEETLKASRQAARVELNRAAQKVTDASGVTTPPNISAALKR